MITGQQVKEAMISNNIQSVAARRCSICDTPLSYERQGEDLFFDSNCDCVSHWNPPQPRDWEDVAEWINMQTQSEHKIRIAGKFGLEEQASA